jgi:1-deoxy-D-xylulose-5-phosphate reductoisomerase
MKVLSVLGSTGSIGTNTLKLIAEFPKDFRVAGLCAGKNAAQLAQQTEETHPEIVSSGDEKTSAELQNLLRQRGYPMEKTRFVYGVEGHIEVACHPKSEIVLSAISGAAGLLPTYRALESGKIVALANKETMVMAAELMTRIA